MAEDKNLKFSLWLEDVKYKLAGDTLTPKEYWLGVIDRCNIIPNGACAQLGLKQLAATVHVGALPTALD